MEGECGMGANGAGCLWFQIKNWGILINTIGNTQDLLFIIGNLYFTLFRYGVGRHIYPCFHCIIILIIYQFHNKINLTMAFVFRG